MKKFFTIIIFLIVATTYAQNFHFEPTNVLNKTINPNNISDLNIDIIRDATADTIYLEYELISNTLPNEWYQGYCDNHGCWGSLPESGVMSPCYEELNSFIRLSIDPNGIEGSGIVEYYVYESGQYDNGLLMTFNVDTPGFVGLSENHFPELEVYPNPANDFIKLVSNSIIHKASIYNLTGQHILEIPTHIMHNKIDISAIKGGVYLIIAIDRYGNQMTKKVLKN